MRQQAGQQRRRATLKREREGCNATGGRRTRAPQRIPAFGLRHGSCRCKIIMQLLRPNLFLVLVLSPLFILDAHYAYAYAEELYPLNSLTLCVACTVYVCAAGPAALDAKAVLLRVTGERGIK
jgi:hypothetical protein